MINIDFFTFIYGDTYTYAEYLRQICETFSSHEIQINYKCIESVRASKIPYGYTFVGKTGENSYGGSARHSMALKESLNHITSKYVILADADIAITYKDWDKIVVEKLDSGLFCFGFSYHRKNGRYLNFPNIFFFCFRSDMIDNMDLDFSPKMINKNIDGKIVPKVDTELIDTKEKSDIYGYSVGSHLMCDTGWKLPMIIRSKGLTGEALPCFRCNSKSQLLPYTDKDQKKMCYKKPRHMHEYHYNGSVFGTHLKRGAETSIGDGYGKIWRERISLYVKNQYNIII